MQNILVTGGAGFIGSNFVQYLLDKYPHYAVVVLDKLTYAGNIANLVDVERTYEDSGRYRFILGDICDEQIVAQAMANCDYVINFASESHVDRSILNPDPFIRTDIYGTYVLLEQARKQGIERFVQISTDEIYGSVPLGYASKETDRAIPSNPYSASKASGEMLAQAYFSTYRLPILITRSVNNYGPFQYPEKLIPLFTVNALQNLPLPLYGNGQQRRDWLYVLDHCRAIDVILHSGVPGEAYNVGRDNEYSNVEVAHLILQALGKPNSLISYVQDRPGHDLRYALESTKIYQLGWKPAYTFEEMIHATVKWYCEHEEWWRLLLAKASDKTLPQAEVLAH